MATYVIELRASIRVPTTTSGEVYPVILAIEVESTETDLDAVAIEAALKLSTLLNA